MGGFISGQKPPETPISTNMATISKQLDQKLSFDAKLEKNKIKLLLLGAGESGKSTIFKQMKVIYGNQFTVNERKTQLPTIFSNILEGMQILIKYSKKFKLDITDDNIDACNKISSMDIHEGINMESGDAISRLWKDPIIQQVWNRRNEYQINESVKYYFDKIDIMKIIHYVPDIDDMLYCRFRTSGIVTERYVIDGITFEMYDVGGQRNERRKWIHCFEKVTAVIFVAGLSDFNMQVFEDTSQNRMVILNYILQSYSYYLLLYYLYYYYIKLNRWNLLIYLNIYVTMHTSINPLLYYFSTKRIYSKKKLKHQIL
jgi:GTPase SAR1 family protein